ncbi:MAG: CvpA family protein [Planctomycetota bacterium]
MDLQSLEESASALALVDWLALGGLALGLVFGAIAGLGRSFATLLWLVAALWLGQLLAPQVIGWLPNTSTPDDPRAIRIAFTLLFLLIMTLPVLGRLLGGSGRKKDGGETLHKPQGAVVGVLCALLLLILALPHARRCPPMNRSFDRAHTPAAAARLADGLSFLYPEAHRLTLRPVEAAGPGADPAGASAVTERDGSAVTGR